MVSLLMDFFWREPFAFVASTLGLLTPVFLVVILRLRWLVAHSAQANKRLRREIEKSETMLSKARTFNKEILERLPQTVWKSVERKLAEGEETAANALIGAWLSLDGAVLSRLLQEQARMAYVRAVTEDRSVLLAAAEGYALAGAALGANKPDIGPEAGAFAAEIAATRKLEGRTLTPPTEAFAAVATEPALPTTPADLTWAAEAMERETLMQYEAGRYRLAQAAVEAAARLRLKTDGENALSILNLQSLKGYILMGLGRPEQALPIVRIVAEDLAAHPDFGPDHPDTLSYAYQLALVLEAVGNIADALYIARDVLERQTAHASLGPNHPDTVETRKLVHRLQGT